VRVVLREGVEVPLARLSRNLFASSSCGVCGKATIEAALATGAPLEQGPTVSPSALYAMPARLREGQRAFDQTGGLHAAALFEPTSRLLVLREDVGRHNAVDKVIGRQWLAERWPLGDLALFVSGRTSFEIVQKAVVAGIPIIGAVSAPSSLAIDLARTAGATLLGFVRGGTLNIYTGEQRIVAGPA